MVGTSMFRVYILKELYESPQSGYDLLAALSQYNAGKRPSPGSIYPLLKDLLETKNVSVKKEGVKKIYALTTKGKKTLAALGKHHAAAMQETANMLKVFAKTSKKQSKDVDTALKIFKKPIENNLWIKYTSESMDRWRYEVIKLISTPFNEKKANKWKQHIEKSTTYMRRLRQ